MLYISRTSLIRRSLAGELISRTRTSVPPSNKTTDPAEISSRAPSLSFWDTDFSNCELTSREANPTIGSPVLVRAEVSSDWRSSEIRAFILSNPNGGLGTWAKAEIEHKAATGRSLDRDNMPHIISLRRKRGNQRYPCTPRSWCKVTGV